MDRILEFIGNNWLLVLALVGVVTALIVIEVRRLRAGTTSIEPSAATLLYNREDAQFIDVRNEADFRKLHLPGAVNVPENALQSRLDKLKRYQQQPVIVYCATGMRAGRIAAALKKEGFGRVYELKGGLSGWQAAGFPLEGKAT